MWQSVHEGILGSQEKLKNESVFLRSKSKRTGGFHKIDPDGCNLQNGVP
jgi:hypothetical protein